MRHVIIGIATAMLVAGSASAQTQTNPSGTAAASGNDNQAVATTGANAPTPAHGHNSFSRGEARRRIAAQGFTHVQALRKDADGVWRGTAQKDGAGTAVWLDYKGNVGNSLG